MRLAATSVVLLATIAGPLVAQRTTADFVGTWELVSIEAQTEPGEWVPASLPLAGEPVGIIMYDDNGNMAVQITGNPRSQESPADNPEIVNGYVAYYAKYEVDSAARTVTHHRRNHLNPEIGNLSVVRYFAFEDDVLTLTVAPDQQLRLNWIRVR